MILGLIVGGSLLIAASGLCGVAARRRAAWGQAAATVVSVAGALMGLAGAALELCGAGDEGARLVVPFPVGDIEIGVDALGAFFLAPIFLMSALGPIFGLRYWRQREHPANGRRLRVFYGILTAALAWVVLATSAVAFLVAWEIMAVSAFFLVSTEDDHEDVRRAGLLYLVATHAGTLCLLALFALMRCVTGSFRLAPIAGDQLGLGASWAVFLLAFAAFGIKAGMMPLHFWLPSAHAHSPSHVSALLSGIVLKIGIYGLLRITSLLPAPPVFFAGLLLFGGAVSGVIGVAFAIGQHDLKRLLAYHSVENIGIILMGLGVALLGRSLGRRDLIYLGVMGCLLHVWNHGLFKALLFLCAGAVVHAVHTRRIDQMGGLAKAMPRTAGLFALGAVAICGLPPLNGFVSEILIYTGLFRTLPFDGAPSATGAALTIPALALIGALAVACFVKVFGAVFLGAPRSVAAAHAHECPPSMTGPAAVLAACCCVIGLFPLAVVPVCARAALVWSPDAAAGAAASPDLRYVGWISLVLVGACVAAYPALSGRFRRGMRASAPTWGCGYAVSSPRMQYSASSFAAPLVSLFRRVLRPRTERPEVHGVFPSPARLETHVDDAVLTGVIGPLWRSAERFMGRCRGFQRGMVQHYVAYVLVALVALLLWTFPLGDYVTRLFAR